jgi:hypothetical protein
MKCTKTGCHIFISDYDEWAYGDAFEGNGLALFRLVVTDRKPLRDVVHYTVFTCDVWFERDNPEQPTSTLISANFINHGYKGIPYTKG